MIRNVAVALAAAVLTAPSAAQTPVPPKLLVVISVDQLSTGLFDEYRPQFTGGFTRLASGTVFPNGTPSQPPAPTLGDVIKAQSPASRVIAVSGSGPAPNGVWYWSGAKFQTDNSAVPVPRSLPAVNAALAAALAKPRPPLEPPPFCQAKAKPGVPSGKLARAAGDVKAFAASPELDGGTLALSAALIDEMQLGRRSQPDVLAIRLAGPGNVGQAYGSQSEEMCLELIDLDREIGDFLELLDERGIDYAIAVDGSADQRVPILFWRQGTAATTVDRPVDTSDIVPTLGSMVGIKLPSGSADGHCLPEPFGAACHP